MRLPMSTLPFFNTITPTPTFGRKSSSLCCISQHPEMNRLTRWYPSPDPMHHRSWPRPKGLFGGQGYRRRSSLSLVRNGPLGRGELGDRCHDPPPGRRSVIIASERRQCLRGILPARSLATSEALSIQARGGALLTLIRARDLDGIVAKRLNDPYKAQVTWFKLMRWDRRGYPRHLMNQRRMRN